MNKKINVEILKGLTYQGTKRLLRKMNEEELKKVEIEVDNTLSSLYQSLYQSISLFGEDPDLTIKEYQIMMKGIKKLEVIKGFLIDRIEEKTYMEYEKVV